MHKNGIYVVSYNSNRSRWFIKIQIMNDVGCVYIYILSY